MKPRIEVTKRGYDFEHGNNWVNVPYTSQKSAIVGYIKAVFGEDAFENYSFVLIRKSR